MKIEMVDLQRQYQKIKPEIDMAIQSVINSAHFIKGEEVKRFENNLAEYLDVEHVISCGNGTDALQLALMALNLQPGDEVITADFTFVATAEVIALLGLKPVFVDVDKNTFTIKAKAIEEAITSKTRAIIPIHLFGQTAEMNKITTIAKKYNLYVIEDTAQALGCDYTFSNKETKKAGTIGDIGTTSFFPSKNLGAYGDGGAVFTNDDKLAAKLRMIANHGSERKYYNDIIGINSRLDTLQAAILNVKLYHLDKYNQARQQVAHFYDKKLEDIPEIKIPVRNTDSNPIFHQYTLKVPSKYRDHLRKYLTENDIPSMIYYPLPLHQQKAYKEARYNVDKLKKSIELSREVLSLPMHTELSEKELDFICSKINNFFIDVHKNKE